MCTDCPAYTSGTFCEKCDLTASDCEHGSSLNETSCKCELSCPYGFVGEKCDTCNTSAAAFRCKHSTEDTQLDADCKCKNCQEGWGGPTCGSCILSKSYCGFYGELDRSSCECKCQKPFALSENGTCTKCNLTSCMNGGILNKYSCSCECDTQAALTAGTRWEGEQCEECPVPEGGHGCLNNGTWNSSACKCQCKNNFRGKACDECNIQNSACAAHNRTLDTKSCTCKCPAAKADTCAKLYQVFDSKTCSCIPKVQCSRVCPYKHVLDKDTCECIEVPEPCPLSQKHCPPNFASIPESTAEEKVDYVSVSETSKQE